MVNRTDCGTLSFGLTDRQAAVFVANKLASKMAEVSGSGPLQLALKAGFQARFEVNVSIVLERA